MTATGPEITADMVAERLAGLVIPAGRDPNPAELAYQRAAAVLASFAPSELHPLGIPPDDEALAALLRVCEPVYSAGGRLEWRLPDAIRRETLEGWHDDAELRQAVAANPVEGGPVQRMLSAYATQSATPLDDQPYEELLATARVADWAHGIIPGVPAPHEVQERLAFAEMLAPLRDLAGPSFRGRADVLQRLHDYTGILPPDSTVKAVRRRLRRFFRLSENPPLVLHGPGGVGKSTVLAKFMLDHVDAEHRIPFVYIDFDRPGMLPQEPLTLLLHGLRQLGVEYPEVHDRAEALRAAWMDRLSQLNFDTLSSSAIDPLPQLREGATEAEMVGLRATVADRDPFCREFADLAEAAAPDQPLLFVLDTFEIVQHYGTDVVHEVWEFLDTLQAQLPLLRVVIAGRAPMDEYPTKPVPLPDFDDESARGFLTSLLGPELAGDRALVDHIVRVVGHNPLSLRLAADLVADHGPEELEDINKRRAIFARVKAEQIQGWLYRRILERIVDLDVRALAHPGLVVRNLTPGVIRYVLAGPCKLEVPDDERAQELFQACSREVSLLSLEPDGSLAHRPDVRREMLPLLARSESDRVAEIHSAAVDYYQDRDDSASRAEELYHRLCRSDPAKTLDERWQSGAETQLAMSLDELPAESQVYLAARLGITLPPDVLRAAKRDNQEPYIATRVRQLIRLNELDTALTVLRDRPDRTPGGHLDLLEATVLERLGRLSEAGEVLDRASEAAADAGDGELLIELQYAAARLAERQGRTRAALELLAAARAALLEPHDPLMPLRLWTTELRLRRLAGAGGHVGEGRPADPGSEAGRAELLELVDATPTDQIAQDAALLVELTSEVGEERPYLLLQALQLAGLRELTSVQARKLAQALAEWNARNNNQPAQRLRLSQTADSASDIWAAWLTSTPTSTATQALVDLLKTYPAGEHVTAVLASLYRESPRLRYDVADEVYSLLAADPPTWPWVLSAFGILAAGTASAYLVWRSVQPADFMPSSSYAVYAGLFVMALAIERILEPFSGLFLARTKVKKAVSRATAARARSAEAYATTSPLHAATAIQARQAAAVAQKEFHRSQGGRAVLMWATASVLAMLVCASLGVFLLRSIGAPGEARGSTASASVRSSSAVSSAPSTAEDPNRLLDLLVTGLVVGAGTKPLHDLISQIQTSSSKSKATRRPGAGNAQ